MALVFWPLTAAAVGYALGTAGLVMVVVTCAVSVAWALGRLHQSEVDGRLHLVGVLASFTDWAEHVLASAPDELDAAQEELRRELQRDYHEAQRLLEKLRG